jgi:hypothetical protein
VLIVLGYLSAIARWAALLLCVAAIVMGLRNNWGLARRLCAVGIVGTLVAVASFGVGVVLLWFLPRVVVGAAHGSDPLLIARLGRDVAKASLASTAPGLLLYAVVLLIPLVLLRYLATKQLVMAEGAASPRAKAARRRRPSRKRR